MNRRLNSSAYLDTERVGVILHFSSAVRMTGGTKIVVTRKMREMAVCVTAFFAVACDLPLGSSVSGSSTSMPYLISDNRIK